MSAPAPRAWERRVPWVILVAAALPRAWAAWSDQGVFWPDEIYQSLEPAHLFAFGYGQRAWEFVDGARSWLFPGLLGLWLKLLAVAGLDSGTALVIGAKLLMAAVAVGGVWGTMRLALRLGGPVAAALAGLLAATFPLLLLLAARCMTEMVSGTLLVFAALALVRRAPRDAALAGVLCGAAVFVRYPNGIVLLGFLAWLAAARRGDELRRFLLAALAAGALGGLLDWVTWGAPFHAFLAYAQYNLEWQAQLFGTEGPWYYALTCWTATGPAVAAVAVGIAVAAPRAPALTLIALAYCAVHSGIGHKEFRFIAPVLPLLLALAGVGLARVLDAARAPVPLALLAGAGLAGAMAHRAVSATFADFGQYRANPAGALSPWRAAEGANRMLWVAGEQPDLCGLWVTGVRQVMVGGYAYLHRDVPLVKADRPESAAYANYAIAPAVAQPFPIASHPSARLPGAYVVVAEYDGWELYRRDGECASTP